MNHHASMNRIYRLVWNQVRSAWIPVAETARGRGKSGRGRSMASANRSALTAAVSLALGSAAHAAPPAPMCLPPTCGTGVTSATSHPVGAQVVSGTASITQSGNTTDVRQSSPDVSIDWLSFNVGSQATVDFIQPSASAVAVNRISGTNGSEILGHLDANGQVYLINPNGIVFGQGAQVNVGGLVASTLDANSSSTPGAQSFAGNGTGSVVNQGTITAANGGYVVLVGNRVSNEGVISARLGTVALGAGSAVTLDFSGNRLVHLQVDQSTLNDLAANSQLIQADGGLVVMTAGAQRTVLASVVNNTGVIEARTVENHDGTIELLGGMTAGTVNVGGTLDASAPAGGNGGFIETNAAHVEVANGTKITTAAPNGLTGSWLIDPSDFTIAPSGGDITGATLSTELTGGNVTILSSSGTVVTNGSGNINVDDTVSWSANTLTLNAYNNININSPMNGSGSASLALLYGQGASSGVINGAAASYNVNAPISLPAGPNFSTQLGSAGAVVNYTVVDTMSDVQNINNNLAGNYALGASLDATNVGSWTPLGTDGASHVLNSGNGFSGIFDGLGNTISNLTINLPGSSDVGLFGYSSGTIRNIGLVNVFAYGLGNTGALVGFNAGSISNSYSSAGFVYGDGYNQIGVFDAGAGNFGGLVGVNRGSINNSYTTGYVYGEGNPDSGGNTPFGGLVGLNYGSISKSYSTSTVEGHFWVGGLVGINVGSISESYATGTVGLQVGVANDVGGLVGSNYGPITNSYATGTVVGGSQVGGSQVGGLVGGNNISASFLNFTSATTMISNSYATGSVSGQPNIITINGPGSIFNTGGLVGTGQPFLTSNSYWNTQTSGQTISEGGSGLTTAQMQSASNFAGWNIATTGGSGDVWRIYTGSTFPLLIDLLTPLTLASSTVTYNGSVQTGPTTTVSGVLGAAATGTNAGSYDGYYSTQQGYDITGGSLTIDPASVTLSGTRTYDGTTLVAGSILSAVGVDGQTFSVTGAGDPSNLSSKNVQTDSALATVTGLTLGSSANGGLASNYYALSTTGSSITITPAPITISAVSDSKTYDGTTNASAIPIVGGTIFSGDTLSTLSESFASKNVMGANGSTLNINSFVISDGNNGNNYSVTVESASGTITPLSSVAWVGGAAGNWSTASNWAGGIIPDLPNVLAVTIPKGTTVTYDSGVVGATTLTTLTDAGNFVMTSGSLSTTGNFTTAGYQQTGGALDVAGSLTIRSPSGGVTLGDIDAGTLNASSLGGAITQLASAAVEVAGATKLTANNGLSGTNAASYGITLTDAGNNFGGAVSSLGSNIDLTDGAGRLTLGNTTASGTLTADSGGAITQAKSTEVTVDGATSLIASGGITLGQANNNFLGGVAAQGSAITLDDAGALSATLDSSGASTLTSVGAMNVSGTVGTTLKTTTTGSDAATTFGATTVGKSLNVTSTGAVTETSSNTLEVDGQGTTTVANAHVTVNGTKRVKIFAP